MTEPFTPKLVHDFVMAVMKGSQRAPGVKSDEIQSLTEYLNWTQQMAAYRRGQLPAEIHNANAFLTAIEVLATGEPELRGELVHMVDLCPKWAREDMRDGARQTWEERADRYRADLAALDALTAAARLVRERQLPFQPIGILGTSVEHWPGYAMSLVREFQKLTGGSKEAAYRFISEVTPRLTGEKAAPETVKTEIMRQRARSRP
jgi:hypothetical protein